MIKNYTQQDLKLAYQIVQADLFNSLTNLKNGDSLRLGSLGKFTKKEYTIKSALFKKKLGDKNTFVYYRINFKPFSKLKKLLINNLDVNPNINIIIIFLIFILLNIILKLILNKWRKISPKF